MSIYENADPLLYTSGHIRLRLVKEGSSGYFHHRTAIYIMNFASSLATSNDCFYKVINRLERVSYPSNSIKHPSGRLFSLLLYILTNTATTSKTLTALFGPNIPNPHRLNKCFEERLHMHALKKCYFH